ncbi:hypothetical protein FPOAC2_07152 [Fusarium poae]|uniref:AAA+ ATPase domain-containing protein n=1 Tax=Fusarium poae TaxID=36050 RepID=A0A1B8AZH8_FUSPO|nr:hypothetical protein FPOA_06408 [Fusarium poae]
MNTPSSAVEAILLGSMSEGTPQVGAPDQGQVPTPAAVEGSSPLGNEPKTSTDISDTISSAKLFIAAQVLEQEARNLQSLRPDSSTENLNDRLNTAIKVLEEVQKELKQKAAASQQEKANSPINDKPDKPNEEKQDEIVCKVKQSSMEDWSIDKRESKHIIIAYYPSTSLIEIDQDGHKVTKGVLDDQERPYRVKLASEALLQEIDGITGINQDTEPPMLLAPPYKLLVRYHEAIGTRLAQLSRYLHLESEESANTLGQHPTKFEPKENSPETTPERSLKEDITANENSSVSSKIRDRWVERFNHLKLLQEFSDIHLAPHHRTYAKIKSGDLEKIAFEDLCFLFTPGDIIYVKERGYEQLAKVYSLTGGQQRKGESGKEYERFSRDQEDKKPEGYVQSWTRGSWSPLIVDYYTMESDGYYIGPKDHCKQINHFSGERNITDLVIFPLRFHHEKDKIVERLTERGRRYCTSYGHKSYRGITCPEDDKTSPEEIVGDMFVDIQDYYRVHKKSSIFDSLNDHPKRPPLGRLYPVATDTRETEESTRGTTLNLFDAEVDRKASDEFMLSRQHEMELVELGSSSVPQHILQLLPHWVPAYFFRSRNYYRVYVAHIEDIDKTDEARDSSFEDLVIPDSHRNLLLGLIRNLVLDQNSASKHEVAVNRSTQIDIVRGKGQGLIILLHGPPGSGKTSTAETLAAYTRRPLYPITCGDLGTFPEYVENSLVKHTSRAQRWGCILLLDEADVFLSRRDWRDTSHNGLVSVFLRQLEYYSGILFLTTNRVGVLDEAFKSRIHMSLAYPTIRLEQTLEIWKGILDRLEMDNRTIKIKVKFDRSALLAWAERHYKAHEPMNTTWNGRQIRNAFQLAISLGHYDRDRKLAAANLTNTQAIASGEKKWTSVRLTTANFNNIAKTARDFEDYLQATRGNDSDIAKNLSLRHDYQTEDVAGSSQSRMAQKDYKTQSGGLQTPRSINRDRGTSRNSSGYESRRSRVSRKAESPPTRTRKRRDQSEREQGRNDEFDDEGGDEDDIIEDFTSDDE